MASWSFVMDVLRFQRIATWVFQQCGDGNGHAGIQHLLTFVLTIYTEFLSSAYHTIFQCNVHCLLSHPFLDNASGLIHAHFRIVWMYVFPLLVEIWTSFWWGLLGIFIPYSDVCSVACSGRTFHRRWHDTSSEWLNEGCGGWFRKQNHFSSPVILPLHC
jgi:hypothetical protein